MPFFAGVYDYDEDEGVREKFQSTYQFLKIVTDWYFTNHFETVL